MSEVADFKTLTKLIKMFAEHSSYAKVGVLADKSTRAKSENFGESNADIGSVHEYGSIKRNIPQRSFLRAPLMELLKGEIDKIEKKSKKLDLLQIIEKIGAIAKGIVVEGFMTNGYGKWAPTQSGKGAKPGSGNILVDTQQLRDSIDYEVVK